MDFTCSTCIMVEVMAAVEIIVVALGVHDSPTRALGLAVVCHVVDNDINKDLHTRFVAGLDHGCKLLLCSRAAA
jgi:hypothetical protein